MIKTNKMQNMLYRQINKFFPASNRGLPLQLQAYVSNFNRNQYGACAGTRKLTSKMWAWPFYPFLWLESSSSLIVD